MITDLFRPFAYLKISHPGGFLRLVNWILPVGVSFILVIAGSVLAPSVNLFQNDGLLIRLLGFVQSLPGFYLAALAAVATFGKEGLDEEMPGVPPTVEILYHSQLVSVNLTRRRFLCMMFAYLTVLSIVLTVVALGAVTFAEPIAAKISEVAIGPGRVAFTLIYAVFLTQMLAVTFWGIFYLGERMHTPD